MLTCAEATLALEQSKFEKIGIFKKISMQFHLLICKYCRKYKKDSAAIDNILRKPATNIPTFTKEEIETMRKRVQKV